MRMNLRSLLQLLQASNNVGVLLKSDNTTGFGMNIQGNMNEGIYVKTIVPMGAADQTGNILPGKCRSSSPSYLDFTEK